jgi:hypothetical protein
MEDACRHEPNESARYVNLFLFRGDDVDKKVKVLSEEKETPGACKIITTANGCK